MSMIESKVNNRSEEFLANAAHMRLLVEDLQGECGPDSPWRGRKVPGTA